MPQSLKQIFLLLCVSAAVLLPLFPSAVRAQEPSVIPVGEFSKNDLTGWKPKEFAGKTRYTLSVLDGSTVLRAQSRASASGLVKSVRIDLKTHPFLNWTWRIENRLDNHFDETKKSGDDYAVRIYAVVSGGIAFWRTRAVNYVWTRTLPREAVWPNAFAPENNMMKALQSGESKVSAWQTEKQNVYADFKRLFKEEVRYIDAVGIMSDTDNTGTAVEAYYGDIYFSSE